VTLGVVDIIKEDLTALTGVIGLTLVSNILFSVAILYWQMLT
jgi:hypothetical protein